MLRQAINDLPVLRFVSLAGLAGVTHAVTTRIGGVSAGAYASLNLGQGGDDPRAVERNLETVREALGLKRLVFAHQTHGTHIVRVNGRDASPVAEADGLVTDQPGVGLLIKQADCQALVMAAPAKGIVANFHVGWRGNVADLPGIGVRHLGDEYGVKPEDLWVGVSPSLGPCCAEFVNYQTELPQDFQSYQVRPEHFDLWQITLDQLTKAGVPLRQIEVSGICTRCGQKFFSYRREGVTGRFGSVVAIV
jgi:hypothetical protein